MQDPTSPGISCLMPFYAGDEPQEFAAAVQSVLQQSRPPDELVFVQDGPVSPSLLAVVDGCADACAVRHIPLASNQGLGIALAHGLRACRYSHVARMDADDLCRPQRFALQWAAMSVDPGLLLVGGVAEEFQVQPGDLGRRRPVQTEDKAIRRMATWRNPFNHMTVMFRRDAVLAAGNYRDCLAFEDYDLWLRLLQQTGSVRNLDQTLVDARAGDAMLARRRGWPYAKREWAFLRRCHREGLLSSAAVARAALIRLPLRMLPASGIAAAYARLLRRSSTP